MEEVPVIVLRHLTEAQKRALVIADNQLALNAGWDEDLLHIELAILHEEDYDLSLVGFDDIELQRPLEAQDAGPGLTKTLFRTYSQSRSPAICSPSGTIASSAAIAHSRMSYRGCCATPSRSCWFLIPHMASS